MVSSCVGMVNATFNLFNRSNINCIRGMRTKRHRDLDKGHRKKQEESETKVLDFMHKWVSCEQGDVNEQLVSDFGGIDDPRENWVKHRQFWIRGISRGTGMSINTVTKALERLKEKDNVWENPIPSNVRRFQLTYPGWEDSLKDSLNILKWSREQAKRHHTTIRIPKRSRED